ncbi:DUF6328 family protein [Pseudonocardia saturnea]
MVVDDDVRSGSREPEEDETRRLDRNWDDLLQELRVAQTGVQLLTGLLLTVPFQARFPELAAHQRVIYLVVVSLSVLATGLLISPVVLHRVLFRQNARATLVAAGQRFALAGFTVLGFAVVGVITLIFDVVLGATGAAVAGTVTFVVFLGLWGLGPLTMRRMATDDEPAT